MTSTPAAVSSPRRLSRQPQSPTTRHQGDPTMTLAETPVDNGGERRRPCWACATRCPRRRTSPSFQWRADCELGEGHPTAAPRVETFYGFQRRAAATRATYVHDADHPLAFAAEDNGITPVEYVLVALGSCLTAGIAAVAQQRKIQLRSVRATLRAGMDLPRPSSARTRTCATGSTGSRCRTTSTRTRAAEDIRCPGGASRKKRSRRVRHPHQTRPTSPSR